MQREREIGWGQGGRVEGGIDSPCQLGQRRPKPGFQFNPAVLVQEGAQAAWDRLLAQQATPSLAVASQRSRRSSGF